MAGRVGSGRAPGVRPVKFTELRADDAGAVDAAAAHLSLGGLLAHPTGSVYGIGGAPAIEIQREVARLKGRPPGPRLVHLVAEAADARRAWPTVQWPSVADRLAARFWPGPLTLVLDDGSEHGVAVRVEPHEFTRSVVRRFGRPLSSTSLNLTGDPPAADAEAARATLEMMPASELAVLFVDAGRLPGPPASTLVRVTGEDGRPFDVLRAGAIDTGRLEQALQDDADGDASRSRRGSPT